MNKILLLICSLHLIATCCWADCNRGVFFIWPSGSTLKQNSIFVISSYLENKEIFENLNKDYFVILKSKDDIIRLNVIDTLISGDRIQVVLSPERRLKSGLSYRFSIDGLPSGYRVIKENPNKSKINNLEWKVEKGLDTIKPYWKSLPKEFFVPLPRMGSSMSSTAYFKIGIVDLSQIMLRTTLTSIASQKKSTFLIEPRRFMTQVEVGSDSECGGPFLFEDGDKYLVTFEILDASGNIQPWTRSAIRLNRPIPQLR